MKIQVEAHLQLCRDCKEFYNLQTIAEEVINLEKAISPDPFLTARIMDRLGLAEDDGLVVISPFMRVFKPALIVATMAAAIFTGVLIGNINQSSAGVLSRPVELSLMDDVAIESVNVLSNE